MNPTRAALALTLLTTLATASPAFAGPTVKIKGTLGVDAKLSHKILPNYAATNVYASIKIRARDFVSEARVPLNVALVIDRSGSMSGDKMRQARVAALKLIDVLGPKDRLSLVTYSTDVSVPASSLKMTPENKKRMIAAVQAMEPGGYTNLSGGFEQGCRLVSNTIQEESVNRVLLMSDGVANRGVTDTPSLSKMASACLKKGVSLTTIGLGLDYNEDLMTAMAQAGAGNYHFVENESYMASIFGQEATGLASTVARKARLKIKLARGVEMIKLRGFKYTYKKDTITVPLSEFSARQRKEMLVTLSVSAQKAGARDVMSVSLTYDDVLNSRKVKAGGRLAATISGSKKKVAKNIETKVFDHAQRLEVSDTMNEAMAEYGNGNRKKAIKLLERQRSTMKSNRAQYNFSDSSAYDRVDDELKNMKSEISANAPSSKKGKSLRKAKKSRAQKMSVDSLAF